MRATYTSRGQALLQGSCHFFSLLCQPLPPVPAPPAPAPHLDLSIHPPIHTPIILSLPYLPTTPPTHLISIAITDAPPAAQTPVTCVLCPSFFFRQGLTYTHAKEGTRYTSCRDSPLPQQTSAVIHPYNRPEHPVLSHLGASTATPIWTLSQAVVLIASSKARTESHYFLP